MKLLHMSEPLARKLIDGVAATPGMDLETFVAPLDLQPELIPCVREFDFYDEDWVHKGAAKYVEPMIQRVPLNGGTLPQNPSDLYHPIPSGKKIIFGTSGSQVSDYEDKARQFFRSLMAMMKTQGLENHHLVLAVGDKLFAEFRIEFGIDIDATTNLLPANVTLSPWISQLEILNAAEVVFMHGGLATIKESIWEKVPIVIVPHGKDQMENALRIERAGIGFIPETQNPSPIELKRLLTKATTSPWMKTKLEDLQKIFVARENASPKPSVGIISAVVAP